MKRGLSDDETVLSDRRPLAVDCSTGLIVLDNLHIICTDRTTGNIIAEAIDRSPPSVKWLLATRSPCGLPIASWFAQGAMGSPVDHSDLLLTTGEMHDILKSWRPDLSKVELAEICSLVHGWPVGMNLVLKSLVKPITTKKALLEARDLLFEYIDEQVFMPLTPLDQRFTIETCPLSYLDCDVLSRSGYHDAASNILRIQEQTSLITHEEDHVYAYETLFKKFLERKLSLLSHSRRRGILHNAAEMLQRAGSLGEALLIYSQIREVEQIRNFLATYGWTMIDRGFLDDVKGLLFSEEFDLDGEDPELIGLRAEILGKLGRVDESNAMFSAIVVGGDNQPRPDFAQRYAASLINQYRHEEASELLQAIDPGSVSDKRVECRLWATLAAAQTFGGQHVIARHSMRQALQLACRLNDAALEATVLNGAAFVSVRAGELDFATSYATKAIAVAEQSKLYNIAARAHSTLAGVSSEAGDQVSAFNHCVRMLDCAERAGDLPLLVSR